LGGTLAEAALPKTETGALDLSAAPRRALLVTLQLGVVMIVSLPLLALTQPFLPGSTGAAVAGILFVILGITFWRSATNLQGHVRAGAEVIVEVLASQAGKGTPSANDDAFTRVKKMFPGLGDPVSFRLEASSPGVGRTLAELNLRGQTGATVLAIVRGHEGILVPTAREALREGDVLALAGAHECIEAAIELLTPHHP
jgi:CPA2 family monovalent cation:H+ antiporter-2